MMELVHNVYENRFLAIDDDIEVGKIEYELESDVITITHTYAYVKGKGIGRFLVVGVIEYAKSKGMKIRPQCSYARALMNKVEEYRCLIA